MTVEHTHPRPLRMRGDVLHCDVVVVGGGPAGLNTALELKRRDLDVVLVEESEELGGQYYKRRLGAVLRRHGDYRPLGTELVDAVRDSRVRVETGRIVWGVDDEARLLTSAVGTGDSLAVDAQVVVAATGSYERVVPFPGWQLPGVVTPGYALHLATCDLEPVGRRALLAGTGAFLLPVACALLDVGVEVLGIVEYNHPYRPSGRALHSLSYPARLRELAGYLRKLASHRVPIWQGVRVEGASGDGHLQAVDLVSVRGATRRRQVEVDALAVSYGFRPATELVRLLGVRCRTDEQTGDVIPVVDPYGRTSTKGIYAAGEVAGIAGVHAAIARGQLVAAAVLEDLGRPQMSTARQARRAQSLLRFAELQNSLFPVSWELASAVPDHTQVCRCEGVTAGEIRAAATTGWNDRNSTKGCTRAGMGPCQGRQCGFAVGAILDGCEGARMGDPFRVRVPIKPVPVRAAMGTSGDE